MRRYWRILALLPLVIMLTGCWTNRPVEERSLVLAMGFGPAPHGRVAVTVQVPTRTGLTSLTGTSGSGGSQSAQVYSLSAEGSTPGSALSRIQGQVQTDVYLGQIQLLVFSRNLTRRQFLLIERFLTRLAPMDKTAFVIATPSIRQFFHTLTAAGQIPALVLASGFKCRQCATVTYNQTQWDLEMSIPTPGSSLWMPYVIPIPTGFQTDRILVYRGLQPVWALSPRDTILLGYLLGRTGKGYLSLTVDGERLGVRMIQASPHVSAKVVNGRLVMRFNLALSGTLDTWTGQTLTPTSVNHLDAAIDRQVAAETLRVMKRLQADGAIPGNNWLAPFIWRQEPGWRNAATWEAQYHKAGLIVHTEFHFNDVGDSM